MRHMIRCVCDRAADLVHPEDFLYAAFVFSGVFGLREGEIDDETSKGLSSDRG